MAIRIAVTLVIEFTDDQQADFAERHGLNLAGKPRARDVVESVQQYVLGAVQGVASAFGNHPGDLSGATVTIKER